MLMFPLLRGVRDGTDSEEKSPKPRRQTEKRRVGGEIKLRRLYTYVRVSYVLSLSARLFMLSITWPPGFERIQKKKGKKKIPMNFNEGRLAATGRMGFSFLLSWWTRITNELAATME